MIGKQERSATTTALEKTECFLLNPQKFEEELEALNPALKMFFRIMVQTIKEQNERIAQLES
jgi:CRP-like cAMP-binding protein